MAKAGIAAGALAVGSAVLLQEVGTAVEALGALALGSFAINSFLSSSPPSSRQEAKCAPSVSLKLTHGCLISWMAPP